MLLHTCTARLLEQQPQTLMPELTGMCIAAKV